MANSSAIGKRGENQVAEKLREYWNDPHFIRNWFGDSGAVGTMLADNPHVPEYILEALTSDIVAPQDFPFSVESKLYKEVDLYALMRNPENCDITSFWKQCRDDAKRINKIPLVMFREKGRGKVHHVIYRPTDLTDWHSDCSCLIENEIIERNLIQFICEGEKVSIATWEYFSNLYSKDCYTEGC